MAISVPLWNLPRGSDDRQQQTSYITTAQHMMVGANRYLKPIVRVLGQG